MAKKVTKAAKRYQKQQSTKQGVKKTKPKHIKRHARPNGGVAGAQPRAAAPSADAKDMDMDEFLDGGFEGLADGSGSEEDTRTDDLHASLTGSEDDGDALGSEDGDGATDGSDAEGDDGLGVASGEADAEEEEAADVEAQLADEAAVAAVGDPVAQDNKRLRGQVAKHKAQLDELKQKDPEFWAYLQQTDAELLSFGRDDSDDSEGEGGSSDDDESSEDEHADEQRQRPQAAAGQKRKAQDADSDGEDDGPPDGSERGVSGKAAGHLNVTSELVRQWVASVRATGSLASLRHLIRAYRLACHYGDSEAQVEDGMRIASAAVYNGVMMFMLREGDAALRRCLGLPETDPPDKPLTSGAITKSPRWRKVGPLVKSFLGNSLHALSAMTDAPLLAFTLRRLRASVPFMTPQPLRKFGDKLLKAALHLWGTSEAAAPRLQAFLVVRQLALTLPEPFLDKALRGAYRTFLANAKFVSPASAPHIAFMVTCAVELWGLDMQHSYAHAFSAIRQLAVSLRGALTMKTQDAYKEIYCWQGVNALELWARVLATHAAQPALKPLVYPLVQLLLGAARLVPTPRFFPLRLRLLRATARLATATKLYVPLAAPLLDMLHWAELSKPPKGGAGSSQDLALMLRAGKNTLRTVSFQEEIVTQVLELLAEHLSQWACHPALPELAHLPTLQLRRFARTTRVDKFRKASKALLEAVAKNVAWVGRARDAADFPPSDVVRATAFLSDQEGKAPLQLYAAQLAAKAAQRAAVRSTNSLRLGGKASGQANNALDGSDDNSDDDVPAAAVDDGSEEEEEEEEENAGGGSRGDTRLGPASGRLADMGFRGEAADEGEELEDLVADGYQLSDDEEEDATQRRVGKVRPRAAAPAMEHSPDGDDSDDGDEEDAEEDRSDGDDDDDDDDGGSSEEGDEAGASSSEGEEEDEQEQGGARPPAAKKQRGGAGGAPPGARGRSSDGWGHRGGRGSRGGGRSGHSPGRGGSSGRGGRGGGRRGRGGPSRGRGGRRGRG